MCADLATALPAPGKGSGAAAHMSVMETLAPGRTGNDSPQAAAPGAARSKWLSTGMFVNVALAVALAFFIAGAVIPALTGGTVMTVMTGSMAPSIPPGHIVVFNAADPDTLKNGDVIAYQPKDNITGGVPITHRVVGVEATNGRTSHVIVQGDANPVPDRPVEPGQIIGKMSYFIPYAGLPRVAAFHSGLAWLPTLLSGLLLAYAGVLWSGELRGKRRKARTA